MGHSSTDLKAEFGKTVAQLQSLRDEVKLKLHLAGLDAKDTWNKEIEPQIGKIEDAAHEITEASREAAEQTVRTVKAFLARL